MQQNSRLPPPRSIKSTAVVHSIKHRAEDNMTQNHQPEDNEITYLIEPLTSTLFIKIEGGEFMMGTPESEPGRSVDEKLHRVILDDFWISESKINYHAYCKHHHSHNSGERWINDRFNDNYKISLNQHNYPVVNVSWDDAVKYSKWLSDRTPDGLDLRLPTEAEWEYTCRAGSSTPYYFGDDQETLEKHWMYLSLSEIDGSNKSGICGGDHRNNWGARQLIGSIGEWCQDTYLKEGYEKHDGHNPVCLEKGEQKVLRGGPRSGTRFRDNFSANGFRLVMEEVPATNKDVTNAKTIPTKTCTLNELNQIVSALENKNKPLPPTESHASRQYRKRRQYQQSYGSGPSCYCGNRITVAGSKYCTPCLEMGAR